MFGRFGGNNGNAGKGFKLDFDTIARNVFGADADRFKQMAQNMSPNQMNDLMMRFQSLPPEKKQQFLNEIQNEVNKINNGNNNQNNNNNQNLSGTPSVKQGRF